MRTIISFILFLSTLNAYTQIEISVGAGLPHQTLTLNVPISAHYYWKFQGTEIGIGLEGGFTQERWNFNGDIIRIAPSILYNFNKNNNKNLFFFVGGGIGLSYVLNEEERVSYYTSNGYEVYSIVNTNGAYVGTYFGGGVKYMFKQKKIGLSLEIKGYPMFRIQRNKRIEQKLGETPKTSYSTAFDIKQPVAINIGMVFILNTKK